MSLINVIAFGLRGWAALAKLVFVTYLGFFSYDSLLGQFAVFATICIVFTQVAGLEINQTIGRKLHALSQQEQKQLFQLQAIASLVSYSVLSVLIVSLYYDLFEYYWVVGVLILYLEHYTTELYRLYVLQLNPLKASLLLFIKNFGWVLLFITLHRLGYITASIESILIFWLVFLLLSAIVGSPKIKSVAEINSVFKIGAWQKNTWDLVWSSRFFILSAIAIAGIGAVDKLIIVKYFSVEQLGEYYLYQTIASIPALIISFSIGATLWPKCIKLAATGDNVEYELLWKKLNNIVLVVTAFLSLTIALAAPIVLRLFDRPSNDLILLYVLILSSSSFVLCDPYKLNLYITRKDRELLLGNVIQLLLVVAFVLVALLVNKIEAVAVGLFSANTLSLFYYRYQALGDMRN